MYTFYTYIYTCIHIHMVNLPTARLKNPLGLAVLTPRAKSSPWICKRVFTISSGYVTVSAMDAAQIDRTYLYWKSSNFPYVDVCILVIDDAIVRRQSGPLFVLRQRFVC